MSVTNDRRKTRLPRDRGAAPDAVGMPACMRGRVAAVGDDGLVLVDLSGEPLRRVRCECLEVPGHPLRLSAGDPVLVLTPDADSALGVVLGRIGRAVRPDAPPAAEVVIEAEDSLSLRCGDSSVELRKDGKVLIKGHDVVTRAKRTNRIKGGSVAIN
jgi:hypothetical protein